MSDIVAKIRNGTRSDATDLCPSCSRCTIVKGARDNDEVRHCGMLEKTLTRKVSECSGYYNANLPSLKTLYDTATILTTDKLGRIGFIPYVKWKNDSRNEVPDEYYE